MQGSAQPLKIEEDVSEWPVAMLLDELWLRGRRALVRTLEREGMWPSRAQQQAYRSQQRDLGRSLCSEVLEPCLGPNYPVLLHGDTVWGPANLSVRRRLPYVLAFGRGVTTTIRGLVGADRLPEEVGKASALFNLGVSLFDLTHDGFPDLATRLGELLTPESVAGAAAGAADFSLTGSPRAEESPEVTILLAIVTDFFRRVSLLEARNNRRRELFEAVVTAHSVELESARCPASSSSAKSLSLESSKAPFRVLGCLAALDLDDADAKLIRDVCDRLGALFAIVDDLSDLVVDVQDGALNSVLLSAVSAERRTDRSIIEGLLDSDGIQGASVEAASILRELVSFPQASECGLDVFLQHSIRAWIE